MRQSSVATTSLVIIAVCAVVALSWFVVQEQGRAQKGKDRKEFQRIKEDLEIKDLERQAEEIRQEEKRRKQQAVTESKKTQDDRDAERFVMRLWPFGTPKESEVIGWYKKLSAEDKVKASKAATAVDAHGMKHTLENEEFADVAKFIRAHRSRFPD